MVLTYMINSPQYLVIQSQAASLWYIGNVSMDTIFIYLVKKKKEL